MSDDPKQGSNPASEQMAQMSAPAPQENFGPGFAEASEALEAAPPPPPSYTTPSFYETPPEPPANPDPDGLSAPPVPSGYAPYGYGAQPAGQPPYGYVPPHGAYGYAPPQGYYAPPVFLPPAQP